MARVKTNSAMRAGMFVMFPVVMLLVSFLRSSLALESESNRAIQEAKNPHEYSRELLATTAKADKPIESTPGAGPGYIVVDIGDVGERKLEFSGLMTVGSEYESDAGLRGRRPVGSRTSTQPEKGSHESACRVGHENITREPGDVGILQPGLFSDLILVCIGDETVAELRRASRLLFEAEFGAYAKWYWGRLCRPKNKLVFGLMLANWSAGYLVSFICGLPRFRSHPLASLSENIMDILVCFVASVLAISSIL